MNRNILILIFLSLIYWDVKGQEIGFTVSQVFSSNYELQDPFGLGFLFALPSNSSFKIKLEYNYHQNTRNYFGLLVSGFLLGTPEEESVQSRSKIHSYEISLNKSLWLSGRLNLYFSFGLHADKFQLNRQGLETGKMVEFEDETKWGYLVAIQPEISITEKIPIKVYGVVKVKQFLTSSVILDAENPFGEAFGVVEIQFGLLYKI
ncbi:MAG: hypothetical protein A2Y94_11350 [Caldithrix sp. RBG_13_44_9]|nr:MAG: hypothetical protein A2Y94_11350 [Caldithrix sp. RBG_13_44_9]